MSTDRLPDYEGRHWAIRLDSEGKTISVHHFSSEEVRDGWAEMDPGDRLAVTDKHRDVRLWLKADPNRKPSLTSRILAFLHLT